MKTFKLTISRAHKVVERIKKLVQEEARVAQSGLSPTVIFSKPSGAQAEQFNGRTQGALLAIARHSRLLAEIAEVRNCIAEANVRFGVHRKLAQQEVLRQELAVLSGILAANQGRNAVPLEVVSQDGFEFFNPDPGRMQHASQLVVQVCAHDQLEIMQVKAAELSAAISRLADEISDLNANKIDIALQEQTASLVGLA